MSAQIEAIRWLDEIERNQGGANGPTIKLRTALAALLNDAARYRVIRQDHEGAILPDIALYAGRALDDYIDAAISRQTAGAA